MVYTYILRSRREWTSYLRVVRFHRSRGYHNLHNAQGHTYTYTYHKCLVNLKQTYPGQFDAIEALAGKAMLHLKDDAEPTIDAPRKCSVHLKDKIKAELDNMEKQGVIRKIEHHTDWCSSMTTVVKKDGSIRICLDPRRLNDALKRCPHKIPTLEEIQPIFAGAQFFSKLERKGWILVSTHSRGTPRPDHLQNTIWKDIVSNDYLSAYAQAKTSSDATHG